MAASFCRPFCKICFYDVLELGDGTLRELACSRQILVENFLRTAQAVSGDGNDLWECATGFGKHRDRSSANVVEMKINDAGCLACSFPLLGEIPLFER